MEGDKARLFMTILLIEDSPEYVELVQAWLALDKQNQCQLQWTDTLAAGLKRLEAGGVDVVLLDLGLPDSDGAATFHRIRERAASIPIIILSAADSESLALDMIRQGAEDYLVKSNCNAATLARSLRYALVRHGSKKSTPKSDGSGRTIALIGAKGGVGTTTIGCLFASELRGQTSQPVVLADFDPDLGLASFLCGVDPAYSAKDAVENLRRLDRSVWDRLVSTSPEGLPVLASPGFLGAGALDPVALVSVLTRIQPFYRYIVADLGRLTPTSAATAAAVDEVLVVTTTGIAALYSAKRSIAALVKNGVPQESIRLVVNNIAGSESLSRQDLSSAFGIPVLGIVPYDHEQLHQAAVDRRLPNESSACRREVVDMVRQWAGLEPLKRKSGRLLPLFSRDRTGTGR